MKKFLMVLLVAVMFFATSCKSKEYHLKYSSSTWKETTNMLKSSLIVEQIINVNSHTSVNLVKEETDLNLEEYIQESNKSMKLFFNDFKIIKDSYKDGRILTYSINGNYFLFYQKHIVKNNIAWILTIGDLLENEDDVYQAIDEIDLIYY